MNLAAIKKALQPVGFACMLIYVATSNHSWSLVFFWLGIALTVIGTYSEAYDYVHLPKGKRSQTTWVFVLGFFVKFALIASLAMRIYEVPYSFYILLACILLSFIWVALSLVVKPNPRETEEWLDVD